MGQQVMDGNLAVRRLGRVQRMARPLPDPHARELWQEVRNRLIQLKRPLLIKHEQGKRGHGLGHGINPPDRIRRNRLACCSGGIAHAFRKRDLATSCDLDCQTAQPSLADVSLHPSRDTPQTVRVKTQFAVDGQGGTSGHFRHHLASIHSALSSDQ